MEGTDLNWRKSSYSGNGGGECVEIGASPGAVVVRDTTDRAGPMLWFTPAAWRRFADQVKRSLVPEFRSAMHDTLGEWIASPALAHNGTRPARAVYVNWARLAAVTPRVRHERSRLVTRGTGRGTAHLRNRCNDGHNRHWTVPSVQAVRPRH
jgi:hypothetical protein